MSAASKPPGRSDKKNKSGKVHGGSPSARTKAAEAAVAEAEVEPSEADEAEGRPSPTPPSSGEAPYRGSQAGRRASKETASIWQRATYRWVAVTVVMAALLVMYTQHPYYRNQQFAPFKTIYPPAFFLWLAFGLFYTKATLEKFSAFRYTMRDSGLHLLLLAKAWQNKKFWRIAKNRRVKTTLLGIIVKGFFTPLMIGFFTGHMNTITRIWLNHKHLPALEAKVPNGANLFTSAHIWWQQVGSRVGDFIPEGHDIAGLLQPWAWSRADLSWGLDLAYNVIFAVDCGWALFGYSTESRWLGNKTRSVEPTAFGWAVCLACYPPFNNVLGTYLPLENGPQIITSDDWHLVLRGATVFLFSIYAAATVSFGFRFSNLTNRGIVSRGPYRFVRHPAYLCKCSAWWLEHLPTLTIAKAFFLSLLCGVYALRAWTEERHLSKDPDYLAYKKKTPWVIFPGVY